MFPIDRPIASAADDLLDRSPIVRRISNALIAPSGEASGVVAGLVGEWGSGKSSILNLLHDYVRSTRPNAVIVRFNPWQITNTEDLAAKYFEEIISAIRERFGKSNPWSSGFDQRVDEAVDAFVTYGSELTTLMDTVPGVAWIGTALGRIGERYLKKRQSLSNQKKRLEAALKSIACPFVVLIDELDRIDEVEVRLMAQLVRSVADFPQFSYLLAYDEHRVAGALGGSVGGRRERLERGRHYLEKIVQVQIRVPPLFKDELLRLVDAEVRKVTSLAETKLTSGDEKRVRRIIEVLLSDASFTPRSVKRLTGSFSGRYPMVAGEVSAADVLGFIALETSAPTVCDYISRNVDEVVFNPREFNVRLMRHAKPLSIDDWLAEIDPTSIRRAETSLLCQELFPAISKSRGSEASDPDDIAFRRPLITLLRLMPPGDAFTRPMIEQFLDLPENEKCPFIDGLLDSGRFPSFLERFEEVYPRLGLDHQSVWRALVTIVEHRQVEGNYQALYQQRELFREIGYALLRICRSTPSLARQLYVMLGDLVHHEALYIPTAVVRVEKRASREPRFAEYGQPFLTESEISKICSKLASRIRSLIHNSGFLGVRDASLLYFLRDIEAWTDNDRQKLLHDMQEDPRVVDQMTFWLFAANYSADREGIDVLVNYDSYVKLLIESSLQIDKRSNDEMLKLSYTRAIDHLQLSAQNGQ